MQHKSIGTGLKEERERLNLGQKEFAEITGIPRNSIHRYETDDQVPGGNALAACAKAGVDIRYVLLGEKSTSHVEVNAIMEDMATFGEVSPLVKNEKDQRVDYDELMRRLTLMPSDMKFMGQRIRFERQLLHFNIGAMASMCDVSEEVWKEYESGQRLMENRILHTFSLLGGDILYVMTGIRDLYTSKNMTESSLLMHFREIPTDRKQLVLDCVEKNLYQEGDDYLPPKKRGGLRWSKIAD